MGIALIFVEFNRPGRALPGALGLLLTLLASNYLLRFGVRPWAILLLACCTAVYLLNARRHLPLWLLGTATLAFPVSLRFLISAKAQIPVKWPVAIVCGGLLGTASAVLTRFAHHAHRSKALD